MDDSQNDLQRWPKLVPVLRDLEAIVVAPFHEADFAARRYGAFYKNLVYIAAILLAVVQLSLVMVEMPWWNLLGDSVATIAVMVGVSALIIRLYTAPSHRRLLVREKAERYRF